MSLLFLSIFVVAISFFGMALGALFRGSLLKGSCGGIAGKIGNSHELRDDCPVCGGNPSLCKDEEKKLHYTDLHKGHQSRLVI